MVNISQGMPSVGGTALKWANAQPCRPPPGCSSELLTLAFRSASSGVLPGDPPAQTGSSYDSLAKTISNEMDKLPDPQRAGSMLGVLNSYAGRNDEVGKAAREMMGNPEYMQTLLGNKGDFNLAKIKHASFSPEQKADAKLVGEWLGGKTLNKTEFMVIAAGSYLSPPQEVQDAAKRMLANGTYDEIEVLDRKGQDGKTKSQNFLDAALPYSGQE